MKTYRVENPTTLLVAAENFDNNWFWSFMDWEGPGAEEMDALAKFNGRDSIIVDAVVTEEDGDIVIQGSTEYCGGGESAEVRIAKRFITAIDYDYDDDNAEFSPSNLPTLL